MKTWRERALELSKDGLRPCEIKDVIEEEYRLYNMYDTIYSYLKRHGTINKPKPKLKKKEKEPKKTCFTEQRTIASRIKLGWNKSH